jgi:aminomethyltransferase
MTYPEGGIVDDLLLYRMEDRFFLVVNAANIDKDFAWLESHIEGDVQLKHLSHEIGLLAVQGPNAQKVVQQITAFDLESMKYYTWANATIGGHEVLFSRTGYTGEDGFELYIPADKCADLWNAIVEAGRQHDMQLIGLAARDSLRLEMKMALYGNDIDQTTTPVEAGLSWIVDFNKDFLGKDVILKQKEDKPARRLVCLEIEGKALPRHGYDICNDAGEKIGNVTSGTFSPSLKKPIALGYVPRKLSKSGSTVQVSIRNKLFNATVVKPPFYKHGTHR